MRPNKAMERSAPPAHCETFRSPERCLGFAANNAEARADEESGQTNVRPIASGDTRIKAGQDAAA
jgi:hypothetical protein